MSSFESDAIGLEVYQKCYYYDVLSTGSICDFIDL